MKLLQITLTCTALMLAGQTARAEVWAYTDPNPAVSGVWLQGWGGNLGMDFTVNTPIVVNALGVFNPSGTGSVGGQITVGIFNVATGDIVSPAVTFVPGPTYALIPGGFDVEQSITPTPLADGTYSIVAVGLTYMNVNPNGNTSGGPGVSTLNNFGGSITFVGGSRYDGNTTLDLPSIVDGGPVNRYEAGTFAIAPEPGFYGLMALGMAGLVFVHLRRRRHAS